MGVRRDVAGGISGRVDMIQRFSRADMWNERQTIIDAEVESESWISPVSNRRSDRDYQGQGVSNVMIR